MNNNTLCILSLELICFQTKDAVVHNYYNSYSNMAAINTVLYAKVALIGLSCKGMYGAVFTQIIACMASVPARSEQNSGSAY